MNNDGYVGAAADDIKVIRDVLTRTMASYKRLAPAFLKLGVIWGAYAILSVSLNVYDFVGLLQDSAGSNHTLISYFIFALEMLLCLVLVTVFIRWGKIEAETDFSPMTKKLIYIWRVFIIVFVVFKLLMLVIYPVIVNLLSGVEEIKFAKGAGYGHLYVLSLLPVIFPALPLILTAIFLEKQNMLSLGTVIFVLSAVWMLLVMLVIDTSTASVSTYIFRIILSLLIRLMPAVSLTTLSAQLKNHN